MDVNVSKISQKMKMSWLSIVGTHPPPLLKGGGCGRGGGRTFKKLSHLVGGGVPRILLERGDKPEKWGLM